MNPFIPLRTGLVRTLRIAAATLVVLFAVACGAPAQVDGAIGDGAFSLRDDAPESKARANGGVMVLLAEDQGDVLRLVTVSLPALETLEVGDVLEVGPEGAAGERGVEIEAIEGALWTIERSDGATVLDAKDPVTFPAVSGTFTLDSIEPLAGTFEVELESGSLDGAFVIEEAR